MKRTKKMSMAVAAALAAAGLTGTSYGQHTLTGTNYTQTFDSIGSGLPTGFTVNTGANISSVGTPAVLTTTATDWANTTGSFKNYASATGLLSTATTTEQAASADRALGIRQTGAFGDPGAAFAFTVANTAGFEDFSLSLDLELLSNQTRATQWTIDYRIGNAGNFTLLGTWSDQAFGTYNKAFDLTSVSALENQGENVTFRVVALNASTGTGSRDTMGLDNFILNYSAITSTTVTKTWDGDGAAGSNPSDVSGTWDAATANWFSAGAHSAWSDTTDSAVFGSGSGTGTTTVTLSGARTAGRVTFAANSPNYTLTGGSVLIKGDLGTGIAADNSATIDSDLALDGAQQNVSVTGGSTLTVSGQVSGGILSKSGAGLLVLSDATNTHAATKIGGGIVQVSADGQLGAAAAPVVFTGGTLQVIGNMTLARALNLEGNGTIDHAGTVTAPSVTGAGRITKTGAGTLVLPNNNSYAGGTTLAAGTIETQALSSLGTGGLQVTAATTLQTTNDLTIAGGITGTAALTKTGAGKLSVGGVSPNNAGASITVASGTLEMTDIAALGGIGTSVTSAALGITLNSGTELVTNFGSSQFRTGGSITLNNATITRPNGTADGENQFDAYVSTSDTGSQLIINGNSTIQSLDVATGTGPGTTSAPSNTLAFRMPVHVNSGATLTVHAANNIGDYGSNAVAFRGVTNITTFPNDAVYIHDGGTAVMSGPGEKRFGATTTGKPIVGHGTSAAEATLKLDTRTFLTDIAGGAVGTRNISKLVVNGSGSGGLRVEAPMNAVYNAPLPTVPDHPDPNPDGNLGLFGLNTTSTQEGGTPPAGYFPIGNAYTVMSPKRYAQLSDNFGSTPLTPSGTLTLAATDAAGATGTVNAGPAAATAVGLALDNTAASGNLVYQIDPVANGGTFGNFSKLTVKRSNTSAGSVTAKLLGVTKIPSVAITGEARLDVTDKILITTDAPGTATGGTYNGLQGEVQRAYNFGSWNAPGLTTSMQLALDGIATVGVATGEQIRGLGPTDTDTYAGQIINGASTIAMYTYAGDANLDGQVDAGDYGILDAFIQVPDATGYGNGDFNYDGFIDPADYGTIDNSIQFQGPPLPTSGSASSAGLSGVTAVPEPASLSVLGLAAAGLLSRRRRAK